MGSVEAWAESGCHRSDEDPKCKFPRDEELVGWGIEAIAAKQPLHQVVQCDSHGRPIDPRRLRRKKQESRRRRKHRHRPGSSSAYPSTYSVPAGMARFERQRTGTHQVGSRSYGTHNVTPFYSTGLNYMVGI